MAINIIKEIDELRRLLEHNEQDFLLSDTLPADKIHVQFEGVMEGMPVVWNACIRTMDDYLLQHVASVDPKQYINIEIDNGAYQLEVGLHVKQIDQAALARTIIMIRKYKRLQIGRYSFGARSKMG